MWFGISDSTGDGRWFLGRLHIATDLVEVSLGGGAPWRWRSAPHKPTTAPLSFKQALKHSPVISESKGNKKESFQPPQKEHLNTVQAVSQMPE
jgi:hypothetical protein